MEKNPANPGLYRAAIDAELKAFKSLEGEAGYRYSQALVRDIAKLQITSLQNDQADLAFEKAVGAAAADVAAYVLVSGVSHLLPKPRQGVLALNSKYLKPGTEANAMARYAFIDMELRYRDLMDRSFLETMKRRLGSGVSTGEILGLFSESVVSTAIGTMIDASRGSPGRLFEVFRKELTMDVAAYRCACVLDPKTQGPPDAWVSVLGPTDNYRTRLGYLLSLKLTPPATSAINVLSGRGVNELLGGELREINKMRTGEPVRYIFYLRSLLVDLETLETALLALSEKGATAAFIEGTVTNLLFGALAAGGPVAAQALSILANAGYGALNTYLTLSDEIKIRMQMAALREIILDSVLPAASECGCGAGVVVVPTRVTKGKPVVEP